MVTKTALFAASFLFRLTVAAFLGLGSFTALAAGGQADPAGTPPVSIAQGLRSSRALPEVLVSFAITTPREDQQLQAALVAYQSAGRPEDLAPLTSFLARHPTSPWRQSLWLNLGDVYYQQGYFSDALNAWQLAWDDAKSATAPELRVVADQALGELVRMHARVGHADDVQRLLTEIANRPLTGGATEAVQGAREGLWEMRNDPGVAYLCGPMALRSLLVAEGGHADGVAMLEAVRSGPHGINLGDVAKFARQAGMPYVPMHRVAGNEIPVPSVVHWAVNHYAAILNVDNGRYLVQDPTFGRETWLTAQAINAQTSGYFMVLADKVGAGWRNVTAAESRRIYGMGYTGSMEPNSDRPYDDKQCSSCSPVPGANQTPAPGMPQYSVHSMLVSLSLQDTPVGYTPPKGPSVAFTLTYNHREANQPATFVFSNVGQKWTHNWLSYVVDDPTLAGANVSLAVAGGGLEAYSGYNSGTGEFAAEQRLYATLVRVSGSPIKYERRFPDGSVHVYQQSDGAAFYPRRIFLTAVKDPAGNALSLTYDAQMRLTTITDALGQVTTLSYGSAGNPLRITRVTDPFGRFADFGYDANGRLSQVTDVIGMSSSFAYTDPTDATFINSMTTLYGTTTFAFTGTGSTRTLLVTDPLGHSEFIEALPGAIPDSDSAATVPTGMSGLFNQYLGARNTFYWDKDAYANAPTDFGQARLKHWAHLLSNPNLTSPVLESERTPGENRVWYNYPGQTSAGSSGTHDSPTVIGRVLPDGSTQLRQSAYNTQGHPAQAIDPVGRELDYTYASNGIDLLTVQRKDGAVFRTIASYTYNSLHLPLTATDDAGQTTTYTYNAAGQPLTESNALSQVSTYTYNANGYLQSVKNPSNVVERSYTYDAYGRVRTATDSEGYVLTYDYDALDRLIKTTYPDGTYEQLTYNKLDVTQSRDRLGRTTTYTFNTARQLTQVNDPLPRTVSITMSPASRLIALYDGEARAMNWQYDNAGRLTSELYANGDHINYAYDVAGRTSTRTDVRNQIKTYSYTVDDRISGITYSNVVNATPNVTFAYDPIYPRMTSMSDGLGTTTWAYGVIGGLGAQQVLREDGPFPQSDVMAFTYDGLGRVATHTIGALYSGGVLSGGQAETLTYDALGRVSTKANGIGTFTFTYLGQTGQVSKRTVAASGTLKTPAVIATYGDNLHDRQLNRLRLASSDTTSDTARLQDYLYTYDAQGRLTHADESVYGSGGALTSVKAWDLAHDGADRLQSYAPTAGSAAGTKWYEYTYDRSDNRGVMAVDGTITQTPTINVLNQIAKMNNTTYSYDGNGNLTNDGSKTYTYNAADRLVQVVASATTTTLDYDGLGRLLKVSSNAGTPDYYSWCGARICQLRNATTIGVAVAARETEFDDGAIHTATGNWVFFRDQLGTMRKAQLRTTGNLQGQDFGPYGDPITIIPNFAPIGRYAGMSYIPGIGLYVTPNRAYSANLGRWMNRDPIGIGGGTNLYAYVGDMPLSATDPLGLDVTITITRASYSSTGSSISGTVSATSTFTPIQPFYGPTMENAHAGDCGCKPPIPGGTYQAFVRTDHTPNRIQLIDVPGYDSIQIHNGSYPRNYKGCIGVGTTSTTDFIGGTRKALNSINDIIQADGSGNITVRVGPAPFFGPVSVNNYGVDIGVP